MTKTRMTFLIKNQTDQAFCTRFAIIRLTWLHFICGCEQKVGDDHSNNEYWIKSKQSQRQNFWILFSLFFLTGVPRRFLSVCVDDAGLAGRFTVLRVLEPGDIMIDMSENIKNLSELQLSVKSWRKDAVGCQGPSRVHRIIWNHRILIIIMIILTSLIRPNKIITFFNDIQNDFQSKILFLWLTKK